jgi:hypothetical protein
MPESLTAREKGYDMERTRRQARREWLASLSVIELWDLWDKDEYGGIRPSDLIPILEAALGDDAPDEVERFGMDAFDYVDHLFEELVDSIPFSQATSMLCTSVSSLAKV